ncbi:MAG: electron transport complex subunit RsxA [Clostridia bacterium]|nr:electron transport complex subunit RsxA [Clostridia bacterium]
MTKILLLMLGAILVENFIFSRFMGICPFMGVSEKPDTAIGMGFAVMFVMTLSSAATSLVYDYLLVRFELEFLSTIVFIVIIASLVQFIEMFLKKLVPSLYSALGIYLPLITTNCAVLGAALLNVEEGRGFVESVVFGFAAAVGFTLALVIFAGVRAKMKYTNTPKSFRGSPIALIAAGLIAMAFAGFSGISL